MTPVTKKLLADFQIRKTKQQKASFRAWLCDELGRAGYAPQVETGGLLNSSNVVAGDPEKAQVLLAAHYDTCAVLPFPNFITPRNFLVYLLFQLLICALFLLIAIATEVAVLLAFDPPLWGALLAIYAVLGFCIWWMLAGKANKHTANDNTSGVAALLETALALPEELRGKVCFVFFDNEEKGLLGSAAFAAQKGLTLPMRELDIPRLRLARPTMDQCAAFVRSALSADQPVAWLNLHSGAVEALVNAVADLELLPEMG